MVAILATALTIAAWGFVSLFTTSTPIETEEIPFFIGPTMVISAISIAFSCMMRIGFELRDGSAAFPWLLTLASGIGGYLAASLIGLFAGLPPADSIQSIFLLMLIPINWLCVSAYWAITVRHIYTDRNRPRWRWEDPDDE